MNAEKWVRCPNCTHKMFKMAEEESNNISINIKCSSCKRIMTVLISGMEVKINEAA